MSNSKKTLLRNISFTTAICLCSICFYGWIHSLNLQRENRVLLFASLFFLVGFNFLFFLSPYSRIRSKFIKLTEQKRIGDILMESCQQISDILDSIIEPFFILDHHWRFIFINKAVEKHIGKNRKELTGKVIWSLHEDAEFANFYQQFVQSLQEQKPRHFEEYFPRNSSWLEFNLYPTKTGLIVYYRDITVRKNLEEELVRSGQRMTSILESIKDAFFSLDHEWRFTYLNSEAEALWDGAGFRGKVIWDVCPWLVDSNFYPEVHFARTQQKPVHFESLFPMLNLWFEIHAYPSSYGLSVYFRDITHRKHLEETLAAEKERLLVTLRSIYDGVIATDKEQRVILINESAEKMLGFNQSESLGQPLRKIFYCLNNRTSESCSPLIEKVYRTGEKLRLDNIVLVNKELREIAISLSCSPITYRNDINGVVLVFKDVSEQQRTEVELLRTEKLESLGILAGGIAHDFNNTLAAILANIQLAMIKLKKGEDIMEYLQELVNTTHKASELTRQLLTFSKGDAPVKKASSIAELIQETVRFTLRGSKVNIHLDIHHKIWPAEIDEGQISQVINNLVINAKQAMPQGGTIRITAKNTVIEPGGRYNPGRYVQIIIQDNGVGIPREHLSKIFDPFFTTKKEGTGLGLSTSYSVIRKHDGYLEVDSRPGYGASFYILLPAFNSELAEPEAHEEVSATGEGLKILLMDDDEAIRNVVGEMLSCSGYRVKLAQDGMEAIEFYLHALEKEEPFDAVIVDLTVPGGVGGPETIAYLKTIDPHIRAIVSSGYANDPIISDYERFGFCGVVTKPFRIQELNEVLNRVIDKKQLKLALEI